jgi:hypothetical protein
MAELFDIPIENINTGVPATPANPFQVDPAQASMAYITAMSDPAFMSKLLGAEQQYRPQFTGLTLQEIEQTLRGTPGQAGMVDIINQITPQLSATQETADRLKRDADIRALQSQSGERDSFKDLETALSNTRIFGDVNITPAQASLIGTAPTMTAQGYTAAQGQANLLGAAPTVSAQGYNAQGYASQGYDAARAQRVADVAAQTIGQGALGESLYGQAMGAAPTAASETFRRRAAEMALSTGQLSPEELRNAQQATREAFAARGLEMSNQAIAGEAMARSEAVRQRQAQDIQQSAALNQAYLADLNASRGFATGVYGQDLGRSQANQDAQLRSALANQAAGLQLSLADQQALNQASQFGAMSANEAAQFGAAARNQAAQFGASAQNAAAMANAEQQARFAMANQAAQNQFGMANLDALNQASQFGAQATNVAGQANLDAAMRTALANQATQTQVGLTNQETMANLGLQNRAFQADQQQRGISNLGLLGEARKNELAANRGYQQNLVGMYGAAFDPMSVVLGRPSNAVTMGQNLTGMAQQGAGGNVFNPDAGINLALSNATNLANYQAGIQGANISAAAQRSAGNKSLLGAGLTASGMVAAAWIF